MDILAGFRNTWRASSTRQRCWRPWCTPRRRVGPRPEDDELDTSHATDDASAYMKHVVDSVNRFCSEDTHELCADGQVIYIFMIQIPASRPRSAGSGSARPYRPGCKLCVVESFCGNSGVAGPDPGPCLAPGLRPRRACSRALPLSSPPPSPRKALDSSPP